MVLALADDGTSADVKSRIVAQMLAAGQPRLFRPGKPVMRMNLLRGNHPGHAGEPELHNFVGKRSWLLFRLLELDVNWMQAPVEQWPMDIDYQRFCEFVKNMNVVNDAAERAVKDVTDFADYCQDPDRRDDVVKVVNSHRELIDFRHLTKNEIAQI